MLETGERGLMGNYVNFESKSVDEEKDVGVKISNK